MAKSLDVRPHYAVISFDTVSGPIKSFARLAAVHSHNAREEELPHVDKTAPKVMRIVGPDDLVGELRARLREFSITPRKNAVLAWEQICTSDRAYFLNGDGDLDRGRIALWSAETVKFLRGYYGPDRFLSADLHPDEYSIHIHPVIVPLAHKTGGRFGDRWTLDVRSISGPGEWQKLQTEYAKAMAPLGLTRGVERSGRRHKPYFEVLADLEAAQKQAQEAEEAADRAKQLALLATLGIAAMHQRLIERLADIDERERSSAEETAKAKRAVQLLAGSIRAARELREALRALPIAKLPKPLVDALQKVTVLRGAVDTALSQDLLSPSVSEYLRGHDHGGRD